MAKKRRTRPAETISKKETRRQQQVETEKRANRAKIFIAVGSAIILIALLWATFGNHAAPQDWVVDDYGKMSYPTEREVPVFDSMIVNYTPESSLEYINYSSRDEVISALLRIPNSSRPVPGILILPGATVTKEGEQGLSAELAEMGYASMVIDQRNRGGVDFQMDGGLFEAGYEPIQHKMVFDALRAVDVMRQYPEIDTDNIAIIGISNGGRFAIIATAIDPSIKGLVGISTSGYDVESFISENSGQITKNQTRFLRSIDPDTYLDKIPPRKLVMIHMTNDSIIPLNLSQPTYDKADEPKAFYPLEGSGHGYNSAMREVLETELGLMFDR
ncbi:MAG: acetylxylan esterase [ANME-2 cluster archaeon]|nr:acetylxylan esterase [ANME-2 cluster archaeon]